MKKLNKKGFTIVELVIVIAVIAILAAVLIPTFANVSEKAKESAAMQAAKNEYTNYLADDKDHITAGNDLLITSNGYVFIVEDGSLNVNGAKIVENKATLNNVEWTFNTTATPATASATGVTATATAVTTGYTYTASGITIYTITYAA